MKAIARVPPSLKGCARFSPDMGFVQPGSFFEFGLRFRPDEECLARCARDGWGAITQSSDTHSPDLDKSKTNQLAPPGPPPSSAVTGEESPDGAGDKQQWLGTAVVEAGMIAVPLTVDVPGQSLPARPVLRARLTGWTVEVACGGGGGGGGGGSCGGRAATVSFGACFVGQVVARRVSLRNRSLLPLKFGFVGSSAEVSAPVPVVPVKL